VTKVRVHELAKELNMENKDLIKLLEKMGSPVKSVQSTLEESDVERVKNQINLSKKEGVVEQRVKPTVIRRRVMREEPAPAPTPPAKEEARAPVEGKPPVGKKGEVKPPVARKEAKLEAARAVAGVPVEAPREKVTEAHPPKGEEMKAVPAPGGAPIPPVKKEEKKGKIIVFLISTLIS